MAIGCHLDFSHYHISSKTIGMFSKPYTHSSHGLTVFEQNLVQLAD